MNITVWLLHGTWAKQAGWTRDGSPLRKALQDGLNGEVTFVQVPWTGNNRWLDRADATNQLLSSLRARSHTTDMNFIVAHSHGGNIAASATFTEAEGNAGTSNLIDSVITLNSPFLTMIPRSAGESIIHLIALVIGINVVVYSLLPFGQATKTLLSFALTALLATVFWVLPFVFQKRSVQALEGTPMVSNVALRPRAASPSAILCIHTLDDEAFGWLDFLDNVLNAPHLFFHKIALPVTLVGIAVAHYFFHWDFLGVGDLAAHSAEPYENLSTGVLLLLLTLSTVNYFLWTWTILALGSLVTTYLVRALAFGEGFSPLALTKAMALRLKVSLTPLYHRNAQLLVSEGQLKGWLRHSDVYDNPKVLKRIVQWMNYRIESVTGTGARAEAPGAETIA